MLTWADNAELRSIHADATKLINTTESNVAKSTDSHASPSTLKTEKSV